LEKINFRPGSDWNEDVAGPNGIGTPIALGHPELVLGAEHYCRGWQPWVCYGAPIHNPHNNSILGCIDITGPADKVCIEAMALAMSITQTIESELCVIQLRNREKLRLAYCDIQINWPNEASFVVDEHGFIIDINSHANILFNTPSSLINLPVIKTFPNLIPLIEECFTDNTEKEFEIDLEKTLIGTTRLLLKPIMIEGKKLGCFIMVIGGNNIINNFTSLRSQEDDLIKNTLIKTNNNISKAAKILNIDRTTIYRRRKIWQ
jgi:transcriptional regulator of acetoin/glycerol metabolism